MIEAGKQICFQAQTDAGNFGHSWMATSKENSSNLYISNTFTKDDVHISHHASGQWHATFPSSDLNKKWEHLAISKSRSMIVPDWYHASRVVIMREEAVLTLKNMNAIRVPFHDEFPGICIDFFIAEKSARQFRINDAFSVAAMELGKTHQVEIVARPYSSSDNAHEVFAPELKVAQEEMRKLGWDGELTSLVLICDTEPQYGFLQQIELRVPSPSIQEGFK